MAITLDGTKGITTSAGLYAQNIFTGTYSDGIVLDYTTGLGRISVGSSDGLAFYNGGLATTELMRIDASGNVGIGTSTAASKLNVGGYYAGGFNGTVSQFFGSNVAQFNGTGMVTICSTNATAANLGGSLGFGAYDSNLASSYPCAVLSGRRESASAGTYSGYFAIATTSSSGTISEAVRVDSSGNLMVGYTSTPSGATASVVFSDGTFKSTNKAPTVTTYNSGSGTYTTPAGAKYIVVEMVGGGGGGSGGGTGGFSAAGNGGNTTFGTNTAGGGTGGPAPWSGTGGGGGTVTAGLGTNLAAVTGARGGGSMFTAAGNANTCGIAGSGGSSPFGGAGPGGSYVSTGGAGQGGTGSGGGGGGGGSDAAQVYTGCGGGSGGYIKALISSPSATYSYAVGAGGTAGAAGTGANAAQGAAGGNGWISVTAYF